MGEFVAYQGFTRYSDLEASRGREYALKLWRSRNGEAEYRPDAIALLGVRVTPQEYELVPHDEVVTDGFH